jgi:hypothetical protein
LTEIIDAGTEVKLALPAEGWNGCARLGDQRAGDGAVGQGIDEDQEWIGDIGIGRVIADGTRITKIDGDLTLPGAAHGKSDDIAMDSRNDIGAGGKNADREKGFFICHLDDDRGIGGEIGPGRGLFAGG